MSTSLSPEQIATVFNSLSDATRVRLLSLIVHNGETCVCDLVEATGLPQANVSRHLGTLRGAGLIKGRKEGLWVYYSAVKPEDEVSRQLLKLAKSLSISSAELREDLAQLAECACAPEAC